MNTANKLSISRIVLGILILLGLTFPFEEIGMTIPTFLIMGKVLVDIRYPIAGFIFVIACVTDYLDGSIARKEREVTDYGTILDESADKVLINGLLIVLAYQGFISIIVPILIVVRDILVESLRMALAKKNKLMKPSKLGKKKTVFMMIGVALLLFYNLPFEVWGIYLAPLFIYIGTILSVLSGMIYYMSNKDAL